MMRSIVLSVLSLAFALTGASAFARQAAGAGPEDAQMKVIEDALKDVRSQNEEKRSAAEEQVVQAIDQLLSAYPKLAPEKQKAVVSTLSKIFSNRTVEGVDRTYNAAAAALSEMGPDAEGVLLKAMKIQHLEKRTAVQATLILALGKHKNEKQIDFLLKLLINDDPEISRAAVEALGEYRESDAKLRKKIAEALVREYVRSNNADVAAKGKDAVASARIRAIEVQMDKTLEMMTLQRFNAAPDWEKWFNDNRNKNW